MYKSKIHKEHQIKPIHNILVIDDHRLFADGFSLVLSQSGEYDVSTYYNARSILDDTELLNHHDLALVDLAMPGLDGFGFLQGIASRKLSLKVMVVSGVEKTDDISRALQLGAKGFLPKNSPSEVMLKSIKTVLAGDLYLPQHMSNDVDLPLSTQTEKQNTLASYEQSPAKRALEAIRPRQLEVLRLLKDGYSNKEIAHILNITESTIKSHIKLLFAALGVKNRTACTQKGIEFKLI